MELPGPRKLLLLTTIAAEDRLPLLCRLIDSVAASDLPGGAVVEHHLLLQQGLVLDPPQMHDRYTLHLWQTDDALSLSAARNRLLHSADLDAQAGAILAFPDDDAWYPPGLVAHLFARFSAEPQLDLLICRYGSQPEPPRPGLAVRPSFAQVLRHGSSNTIFLRTTVAARIGGFDEGLGVGTPVLGGEDTDYAIRAFAAARTAELMPLACVGHRDANPALRARYYIGGLAALAANAGAVPACRPAIARKVLVGLYHFARGRLGLKALLHAWLHAALVRAAPARAKLAQAPPPHG